MKKTWNNFYKSRGRFYLLPHPNFDKVIKKFKAFRVKKILDLGCGSGRHAIQLAREKFIVTGIDFSSEALDLAKQWAKSEKLKVNFTKGNIHKKLPFEAGSFDAAIAIDSIHYSNSEDLKKTLDETARILKTGGLLFVTIPTKVGNPLVSHLIFSKEEIIDLLEAGGYRVIESFIDKRKFLCVFTINQKS